MALHIFQHLQSWSKIFRRIGINALRQTHNFIAQFRDEIMVAIGSREGVDFFLQLRENAFQPNETFGIALQGFNLICQLRHAHIEMADRIRVLRIFAQYVEAAMQARQVLAQDIHHILRGFSCAFNTRCQTTQLIFHIGQLEGFSGARAIELGDHLLHHLLKMRIVHFAERAFEATIDRFNAPRQIIKALRWIKLDEYGVEPRIQFLEAMFQRIHEGGIGTALNSIAQFDEAKRHFFNVLCAWRLSAQGVDAAGDKIKMAFNFGGAAGALRYG